MSVEVGPAGAATAAPAPARRGRRVGLAGAVAVFVGASVALVMSVLWIGWPDSNGLGFYPDGVSDAALAVDHVLTVLATLGLLAVSAVLMVRWWRHMAGPGTGRALSLALGLLLALPTGLGLGAAAALALTWVETAQATAAPSDSGNGTDLSASLALERSPCGYTWACVARTARSQQVRVLVPPPLDGWGVVAIRTDHGGQVVLILARGPALCLLDSSTSPVATTGGVKAARVAVRGTTGVLTAGGLSWAVNWGEAGVDYRVQCPDDTDRTAMLSSLTEAR